MAPEPASAGSPLRFPSAQMVACVLSLPLPHLTLFQTQVLQDCIWFVDSNWKQVWKCDLVPQPPVQENTPEGSWTGYWVSQVITSATVSLINLRIFSQQTLKWSIMPVMCENRHSHTLLVEVQSDINILEGTLTASNNIKSVHLLPPSNTTFRSLSFQEKNSRNTWSLRMSIAAL